MDHDEIEDFLGDWYWYISPERRSTRQACGEVLARLPSDLAEEIVYLKRLVFLLAPGSEWGLARPISALYEPIIESLPPVKVKVNGKESLYPSSSHSKIHLALVFLSPDLEEEPYEVIVAVVAHELAHAISREIIGDESEQLADNMIRQWGFEKELNALRQANPHHRY